MKKKAIFFTLVILLFSCSKPPLPECYNPQKSELTISWGIENSNTFEVSGFLVNAEGSIYSLKQKDSKEKITKKISYIDSKTYCYALDTLQKLIIKHQALYIPSDSSYFIELNDPSTPLYFRAVWNPRFITNVNKEFHELYQILNQSVKK